MIGGAPRMHLTSRSVKGERMSAGEKSVMRTAKGKAGVSGGYCDPSVVMVSKRQPKLSASAKRRMRAKRLAAR